MLQAIFLMLNKSFYLRKNGLWKFLITDAPIKFASALSSSITSFDQAVLILVKETLENTDSNKNPPTYIPTGVNANHTMVKGDIAALMTEIDKAIGPFKFPKFTAADFTPYPTGCLFADGATSANDLSCATFPSVKGTTPAFESYAKFVAELKSGTASVIDYTKSYTDIKNAYFDEFWKPANLAAYKATFGTPAPPGPANPPKPKVDADVDVIHPNAADVIEQNVTNMVDPNAANVDAGATSNSNSSTTESDSSKVGTEKQNDNGTTTDNNSGTQKKSGDSWWILWTILAIAALLGLLGGGYLYYSHTQSRKESL